MPAAANQEITTQVDRREWWGLLITIGVSLLQRFDRRQSEKPPFSSIPAPQAPCRRNRRLGHYFVRTI
jgi:hypothetical protein